MKQKLTNILILLGFPLFLVSQSVSDSILLPEIEILESKMSKHSIGSRFEIINPTIIESSFSESFSDVLQNNSTIYVKRYGALSTPTFRGTSSSHTLFMWNGIPINSVATALTDLRLIPTNSFNEMQISYGGNSSVFGSGSVGGAIDLKQKVKYFNDRKIKLNVEHGSYGMNSLTSSVKKSTENTYFFLNYSKIIDTNNFVYAYNGQLRENEHSLIKGENISSTIGILLNENSGIEYHYWKSDFWREIPANMTVVNSTAIQQDNSERYLFSTYGKFKELNIRLKHAALYDNLYYDDDPKQIHSYYEGVSLVSELDLDYNMQNFFVDLSLLHFESNLNNSSYQGLNKSEKSNSVFSAISYRKKMISSEISIRKENHSNINVPLIPSFSVDINFNNIRLRARVNKNFRSPTFNDRFWIGFGSVGNSELKPESGINKEFGIDYATTNFSTYITLFSLDIEDWILWKQQNNGIWMPENLKEVFSRGLEWRSVVLSNWDKINLYNEINYQYNLSTNQIGINNLDASEGKQLIYTPKHKGNITSVFSFKDLKLKINQSYTGSVFTSSDNINSLPEYYLLNTSLKYSISNLNTDVGISVQNVLNSEYQSYLSYPNPGREFIIQLNIILN